MKEKIAIVGIGCVFPDAVDFTEYWRNIIEGKCSIHDISGEFWEAEEFYDPDPKAEDKVYSVMGATVAPIEFDTKEFGISPKVMQSTDVEQLFSLIAARQALIDAGVYGKNAKPFNKEKAGVIISSPVGKNVFDLAHRAEEHKIKRILLSNGIPEDVADRIIKKYKDTLLDWTEDCNPGYLPNVTAGRIANRFDFGGTSCSVDAACASSLGSIKFAVDELQNGSCDFMLTGGVNLDSTISTYMSFCKTPATSKKGMCTPFDENADGMIIGDGVGIIALKRLSDAKRDGDKIYAVISSVGSSSDGRAKSIYAPSPSGQIRALERAYEGAQVEPKTIGLIEAHGTGTSAGDACEVEAISQVYQNSSKKRGTVIGSVKSQIGHLRVAAGIAGLIKVALSLHEKVLPPSINVTKPSKALINSSLCVLSKPKAWIVNENQPMRRGAVSGFGFGGTNYHVVLEEAQSDYEEASRVTKTAMGVMFSAKTKKELVEKIQKLSEGMETDSKLWLAEQYRYHKCEENQFRLAFVAKTEEEVKEKCKKALDILAKNEKDSFTQSEITYSAKKIEKGNKVTVLFSGQGTQSLDMLSEIAIAYPEMRQTITKADNVMIAEEGTPISELVYPNVLTEEEKTKAQEALQQTVNTQPVLATLEAGLYEVAKKRGLKADMFIGHSFGELVALWADGAWDFETLIRSAKERGSYMGEIKGDMAMFAVMADKKTVQNYTKDCEKVYMANENSPAQTVISGDAKELEQLEKKLSADGIKTVKLKVSGAFHSPYMEEAGKQFKTYLEKQKINPCDGKVIANYNGKVYPQNNPKVVVDLLQKQLVNPVLFQSSIETAYAKGARVFVEVGNGKVLSNLTKDILGEKEHEVIALCPEKNKDCATQFEFAIARLAVLGFDMKEDAYRLLYNDELVPKKTKTTHTVPQFLFLLPDKKKQMEEAQAPDEEATRMNLESMAKAAAKAGIGVSVQTASPAPKAETKPVTQQTSVQKAVPVQKTTEKETKTIAKPTTNILQNSSDAAQIQALNAEVFAKFMDVQTYQIEAVSKMLQVSQAKTETEKKNVMDCISLFQNNSLAALQTYFASQSGLPVGSGSGVSYVEPQAEPVVNIQVEPVADTNTTTVVEERIDAPTKEVSRNIDVNIHELVLNVISDKTGYPTDMIEEDMEMEADLGIDSIKRVEILSDINKELGEIFTAEDVENLAEIMVISKLEEYLESIAKKASSTETQSVASATKTSKAVKKAGTVSEKEVRDVFLEAISDKTGYPTDMIETDMEMEADLGIDSIKRVEIFAYVNDALECNLTAENAEELAELTDIQSIIEYLVTISA